METGQGRQEGTTGKQAGAGIEFYPVSQELGHIMLGPETMVTNRESQDAL